ncbi:uncharacterized protein LOC111052205 [Nilaparvata lugens]|uniref:uncharacterized protein LOC111052205 n=1 Tax=Nilaparvata lugens TaxID=108931 RepID=UPI00193D7453|nr:uncharacterized protein LOC111052205 [Nilaparvata lugens]
MSADQSSPMAAPNNSGTNLKKTKQSPSPHTVYRPKFALGDVVRIIFISEVIFGTCHPSTSKVQRPSTSTTAEDSELDLEENREIDGDVDDVDVSDVETEATTLEFCSVSYFAGYAVQACLKRFKCESCSRELVKTTTTSDRESLINNRQYRNACGKSYQALILPTDSTVQAADITMKIINQLLQNSIHVVGLRKKVSEKCIGLQAILKSHRMWLKCDTACYVHRVFLINKLITAKLHAKVQELSKDLRRPGGKYGGFFQKVKILQGK